MPKTKPKPMTKGRTPKPAAAPAPLDDTRSNLVLVAGRFAPEVRMALKVICAEEDTTVQALLVEAINLLLAVRGRPALAS